MFTVQTFLYTTDNNPFTSEFESIIEAIKCLIARRMNCTSHCERTVLFDGDGFIVPGSVIEGYLRTIETEAVQTLAAVSLYRANRQAVTEPDALKTPEPMPADLAALLPASEEDLTTFRLEGEPLSNAPGSEKLPPAPVTPPTFEKSCAGYYVADLDGTHTANLVNNRTGATPGYEWEITCNDRMTPSFNGTTKKSAVEQFNTWWKANH